MEFCIDTTDIIAVRELSKFLPVKGMTTNPSIVARGGIPLTEIIPQLRDFLGKEKLLFAQVVADSAGEMVEHAQQLHQLDENLIVKIPASVEGVTALGLLQGKGIVTLATAIYTPMQGILAALAGASYLAPYISRIDAQGGSGIACVQELHRLLASYAPDCKILAASFKSPRQVLECMLEGCAGVTVSVEIAQQLLRNPAVDAAVLQFKHEWHSAFNH
ncbi:transaldolase family protein [Pantoea sp. B65]|uniref:transaldolase family protein n=1 Tax=Pantoea sp. B65 TaxID=2813359 RepID=UPI0039B38FC8